MEVARLVGYMKMDSRAFLASLLPPLRALLPPRQLALRYPKAAFSRAEVARISDLGPVADHGERLQSHVNAHRQVGHGQRLGLAHLDAEAHVPAPSLVLGRHRLNRGAGRQWAVPLELQIAHAFQVQSARRATRATLAPGCVGQRVV